LTMVEWGLRVGEVAALELRHFQWRESVVEIPALKTRQIRRLPLTHRTGKAIAVYLRNGRPQSPDSHLFLRHTVPKGTAISTELVRGVMRRAYEREGFPPHWTGTHILRRTAGNGKLNSP